ncbi:rhodanese-like domain-containing protein [Microbacterium sp. 4R-513]|uniref:rhodanese-like domain-containing protein n=1 Tax=Microbacterium sp. 4R-513 TaxID=2567934 RepID=UPI001F49D7F1|nr:rhodanese-like domain-containing protein [Microbacterium sp. 4R-513]
MPHLISPRDVQAELDSGRTVRFLDVRWRLDAPEGRPAYVTAHLPGAVYVDLERELAKRGYPEEGRYPPPDLPALEQSARRWGIDDGDLVVAYDDNDAVAAAARVVASPAPRRRHPGARRWSACVGGEWSAARAR